MNRDTTTLEGLAYQMLNLQVTPGNGGLPSFSLAFQVRGNSSGFVLWFEESGRVLIHLFQDNFFPIVQRLLACEKPLAAKGKMF